MAAKTIRQTLLSAASVALTGIPIGDQAALVSCDNTLGTSLTAWLEGSPDTGTTWFDLAGYRTADGAQDTNGAAGFAVTDAALRAWIVPCAGCDQVRVRASALTGSAVVTIASLKDFPRVTIPANTFTADVSVTDGKNIALGTTTGTKLGTGTTQKLGFFNATPIVIPANTVDYLAALVNLGLRASGGTAAAAFPGLVTSSSPSAGIGYATGAGSTVSQATDRTTGVTINAICGAITTQATSLAAGAEVQFTVTNSAVAVGDVVVASIRSGPTNTTTSVQVVTVAAGSFKLMLVNSHASVADTGAAIINFVILKAVSA